MPKANAFAPTLRVTAFAYLKMTLMAVMALCLTVYAALEHCIRQANIFSGQNSKFVERLCSSRVLQFSNNIHIPVISLLAEGALTLCAYYQNFPALSSKPDAVPYANSG